MKTGELILAIWSGVLISFAVVLVSGQTVTPTEWIAGLKDLATASGVVVAAYVGIRGLSTWEQQLKGNAEFESARALALVTYKLRDQIAYVRSPMLMAHEFPDGYLEVLRPSKAERANATAHVYRKRWEPVFPILQEFDVAALQAEALWGPEVRARVVVLSRLLRKLKVSNDADIEAQQYEGPRGMDSDKFRQELSAIVSDTGEENVFTLALADAIRGIDELLKPHLRWRR